MAIIEQDPASHAPIPEEETDQLFYGLPDAYIEEPDEMQTPVTAGQPSQTTEDLYAITIPRRALLAGTLALGAAVAGGFRLYQNNQETQQRDQENALKAAEAARNKIPQDKLLGTIPSGLSVANFRIRYEEKDAVPPLTLGKSKAYGNIQEIVVGPKETKTGITLKTDEKRNLSLPHHQTVNPITLSVLLPPEEKNDYPKEVKYIREDDVSKNTPEEITENDETRIVELDTQYIVMEHVTDDAVDDTYYIQIERSGRGFTVQEYTPNTGG